MIYFFNIKIEGDKGFCFSATVSVEIAEVFLLDSQIYSKKYNKK